ncbi:MAG TPA: hypothetical protein VJZ71_10310 [Phycisphaerae bacterium]|nr:hypothetical protein [Phycisphaerae bacterium]
MHPSNRLIARSIVLTSLMLSSVIVADRDVQAGPPCIPDPAGRVCEPDICDDAGSPCLPHCIHHNPFTGEDTILDCVCAGQNLCHAEPAPGGTVACIVPEDGTGTVHLPPQGCAYISPTGQPMQIINGLEPDMINCAPTLSNFSCAASTVCSFPVPIGPICYAPGGSLGGEKSCADSVLNWVMQGTGGLGGFNRNINLPVELEIHAAPRMIGQPNQSFDTDMFRLFGQIIGDPDFDLLRIVAGTDFGLPSPGHTTLTQLPGGQWAVDSFFDITYRIDFVGAPGGPLAGKSGSTTGTIRIMTGGGPSCQGDCPPGFECRRDTIVYANGTFDVCCECVPIPCEPLPDGSACKQSFCGPFQGCSPRCIRVNPSSGQFLVTECECRPSEACHAEVVAPFVNPCVVPEDGTGTVHLPPDGCQYKSPTGQPMQILDGVEPDSIDCAPTLHNFSCAANSVCSFPVPIGPICYAPGGSLGGEKSCANSTLNLIMQGTGGLAGFNRNINIPVGLEIHAAPRTPFDPVQSFDTDMFRWFGQIIGDPDFDLLRIVGGSDFGLPSPGHTTLTQLPGGQWAVDSFFDITYRIDFVGNPGGPLAGKSGSTTGTIRIATGSDVECISACPEGYVCHKERVVNQDGSITVCCDCIPDCRCLGDMNSDNRVNGQDIQKFTDCVVNYFGGPVTPDCVCADMDADGQLSTDIDVDLFVVELLSKPSLCPP